MEENLKLYSQKAIAVATYFGGPLAAGILIRKNSLNLGREKQAINSLIIGIISTIIIFGGIFMIPENIIDKIPNALIPAIYTGIIYLIVERIQGRELKLHKENQGEFYSGWKAVGIGAVCMVILAAGIFGYAYASEVEYDFDSTIYDKEIAKFIDNEEKSLNVFNFIETANKEYLIKEFNKGIVLWKENQNVINRILSIENLPADLVEINEKLMVYSKLRIKHFELIQKGISEDTDSYASEIESIGLKIEKLINELN